MSSSAIHCNSNAAKGSISFCSNSFPKPQNDHELVLLMTAEIKKLHTRMKELEAQRKESKEENAALKEKLFGLSQRLEACEYEDGKTNASVQKNSPFRLEAYGHNEITSSEAASAKEEAFPALKKAPASAVAVSHDATSSKPSTEAMAEKKRDERERLAFIDGCERKKRRDGQSFFIRVEEIASLKRVFLAEQAVKAKSPTN